MSLLFQAMPSKFNISRETDFAGLVFQRNSKPKQCFGHEAFLTPFFTGHKNAILELHWTTDGERVITASPDKTVRAWDTKTGEQVKKMTEHDNFVNSCCPLKQGPPLLVSGSDDGSAKVYT